MKRLIAFSCLALVAGVTPAWGQGQPGATGGPAPAPGPADAPAPVLALTPDCCAAPAPVVPCTPACCPAECPDDKVCGPPGRVWARADYLLWWVKGSPLPPLL